MGEKTSSGEKCGMQGKKKTEDCGKNSVIERRQERGPDLHAEVDILLHIAHHQIGALLQSIAGAIGSKKYTAFVLWRGSKSRGIASMQ